MDGFTEFVRINGFTGELTGAADNRFLLGTASVSAVPVPAAVWLFGSGLIGLIGVAHRKR